MFDFIEAWLSPRKWPNSIRKLAVITFFVSFPLWFIITCVGMVLGMLVFIVIGGATYLFNNLKDVWNGTQGIRSRK